MAGITSGVSNEIDFVPDMESIGITDTIQGLTGDPDGIEIVLFSQTEVSNHGWNGNDTVRILRVVPMDTANGNGLVI